MGGSALLALCALFVVGHAASLNPVTRVAQLMQGMVKKIEADGKAEEELYDAYVCWYKTVVSTKTQSNEAAKDRIESLNAYIDDIKSGRVEFTSERKDLEAEIEKLNTEIESSNAMRSKENEDFLAAKDEMEKAIAALESAIDVLGGATEDHKEGVFTSIGFELRRAVQLGQNFLSEQDTQFLERALDGEVPTADWKKLNRKATFKMKYKARSLKIQEILADMLQTFKDNLADATKKEDDAKSSFDTLMTSKNSQLSAAQDALSGGEGEAGARTLNAQESQDEVDALTTQVSNDEKFIKQAEESYAVKVTEWKERKRLRTGEIAAVSKAMEVLTSDDARDMFSSSMKSQQALLLQESSASQCSRKRAAKVASQLRASAAKHNDVRLAMLAISAQFSSKGHFGSILDSIDKMISDLKAEYEEDYATKEQCTDDRLANTKIAKQNAQAMDDETALIGRKQAEIEEKTKEVEDIVAHVKEIKLQMEEADMNRQKENAEYKAGKADDEAAMGLIQNSMDVLAKFYEDEGLALVQTHRAAVTVRAAQPPEMSAAGEAPPPPPATFSQPYGGAKGESNGIQSILGMIKDDMAKDIRTATEEEDKAKADFDTFTADSTAMIESLNSEKTKLEGEIGAAEQAQSDAKATRGKKKTILDDTLGVLRSIAPNCDFMAKNFELRKANRETEIDGLYEAKASLSGGSFKFLQTEC